MLKIFLSYRRDDSKWAVEHLDRCLVEALGRDNVFRDVISMQVGNWQDQLRAKVRECDVLIAVIGGMWTRVANEFHVPRIH